MSRKFRTPQQIVSEQAPKHQLENFRNQVEILELTVRRNKAQKALTGYAVDSRLESFIDIEFHIERSHPEVLPALIEERNNFIKQVGMTEADYLEMKAKDLKGRTEQMAEQPNPTEQLHAIHDEIQNQESHSDRVIDQMNSEPHGAAVPSGEKDDTTVKEETKIINMADTSDEPPQGKPEEGSC